MGIVGAAMFEESVKVYEKTAFRDKKDYDIFYRFIFYRRIDNYEHDFKTESFKKYEGYTD